MKGASTYRTFQIAGSWVMAQNHFETWKKGVYTQCQKLVIQ